MTHHSFIITICVYQHINTKTDTYLTYMNYSNTNNECIPVKLINPLVNSKLDWKLAFSFYAINPMVKPLPAGMALFCAIKNEEPPHNIIDIKLIYDIFTDIKLNGLYFITYTKPVPETIPLHVFTKNNNIFINFCSNPPPCVNNIGNKPNDTQKPISSHNQYTDGWVRTTLSPFFVINKHNFNQDQNNINFVCNNGVLMPYSKPIDNVFNVQPINPQILSKAIVNCNILIPDNEGGGQPYNLLSLIQIEQQNSKQQNIKISKFFKKMPDWGIAIIIAILIITINIVIISIVTKK